MLGAGTSNSYAVIFSVEGGGEQALHRISKGFEKVSHSAHATTQHVANMASIAAHGIEIFEKVGEVGHSMIEIGAMGFEGLAHGMEVLLEKGGELETMWLRLQTASGKTGKQAYKTMEEAVMLSQKLPFTESEIVRLLDAGAVAHIDIMKDVGKSYEEIAKMKGTIADLPDVLGDKMKTSKATMASMFSDVFAKAGVDAGYRQQAMHELAVWMETGKMGASQLKRILGPDWKTDVEAKSIGGHGNAEALQKWLMKHHALGAGLVQMDTYSAALNKFKGLVDLITMKVFEPGNADGLLRRITRGLQELYTTIVKFFDETTPEGKKFLAMLKDVGTWIAEKMLWGMKTFGDLLARAFRFLSEHTALVKATAAFVLFGSAIAIVVGTVLTLVGAVGGLIALLVATPGIAMGALAALGLFTQMLIMLPVFMAVIGAAWLAWERDFAGIKTFFEKVKLVVTAVMEAIHYWSGDTTKLTKKTAEDLEKAGLLGTFLKIVGFIAKAKDWVERFIDTISIRGPKVWTKFEIAFDRIGTAVGRVFDALGRILAAFGIMADVTGSSVDKNEQSADKWANTLISVADGIANIANWMSIMVNTVVPQGETITSTFADIYSTVIIVKNAFDLMIDVIRLGATTIGNALNLFLVNPLQIAERAVEGLMKAFELAKGGHMKEAISELGRTGKDMAQMRIDAMKQAGGSYGKAFSAFGEDIDDLQHGSAVADRIRSRKPLQAGVWKTSGLHEGDSVKYAGGHRGKGGYTVDQPQGARGVLRQDITLQIDKAVLAKIQQEHNLDEMKREGHLPGGDKF